LTKQEDALSTYAKMLKKSMGLIDFTKPAVEIERLIRGLNPWPSAYTSYNGKTMKIWSATVENRNADGKTGEVIEVGKDYFLVQTGEGLLNIRELQLEGKKRMDTRSFLQGVKLSIGEQLGN
jgi:methionyl-tRNA formyltransferase